MGFDKPVCSRKGLNGVTGSLTLLRRAFECEEELVDWSGDSRRLPGGASGNSAFVRDSEISGKIDGAMGAAVGGALGGRAGGGNESNQRKWNQRRA